MAVTHKMDWEERFGKNGAQEGLWGSQGGKKLPKIELKQNAGEKSLKSISQKQGYFSAGQELR